MPDTLDDLVAAATGLLVTSESDYPFEPFRWPGPGPLTPETLLAHLGLPPATPVELGDVERFFKSQSAVRDAGSPEGRTHAARFAALGRRFARLLTERSLYRVGAVEIQIFLTGRDAEGAIVGLRSTLIET